jgi:hypothetical protein
MQASDLSGERDENGVAIHPWRWTALTIWIVIFTLATGYAIRTNRELAAEGVEAQNALCAFNADLKRRIEASEQFLKNNPGPVVLGNVPRSTVISSLQSQRKTFEAFQKSGLECP